MQDIIITMLMYLSAIIIVFVFIEVLLYKKLCKLLGHHLSESVYNKFNLCFRCHRWMDLEKKYVTELDIATYTAELAAIEYDRTGNK